MTHLLGRQDCIDNLRRDLTDLQGALLDVFSFTGPIRFPSWKFPDKMSCNLDLVSLLEKYDFVEGEEEFSQHSHVVLLELVIDRLVLLLQSFNAHVEHILSVLSQPVAPSVSIGLIAKRYWNNMVQLGHLILHLQEVRSKETEGESSAEQVGEQMMAKIGIQSAVSTHPQRPASSACQVSSNASQRTVACVPETSTLWDTSTDMHSVGCQTVTSSLVPCDVCARVQQSLRVTSDTLVRMCQAQGLPSSLAHFLDELDGIIQHGRLSVVDVAHWAAEQSRDMGRIGKRLAQLRDTVQPMKDNLAVMEGEREKLRKQLEQAEKLLAKEREEHHANLEELEVRLQKAQARREEVVRRLESELEELSQETMSLEAKNSKLKAQLSLQQDSLHSVERERDKLQREAKARLEELAELKQQSCALQSELSSQQLLLDKERAKYQSARRQQEATQSKQRALLERLDALDREGEELQERLAQSEESRAELQEKLRCCEEQDSRLQARLTQQQALSAELQEKTQKLEAHVSELQEMVEELKQREKLLVAFPELSPVAQGRPQSTGDILQDMEQQLRANSVRIAVLEHENATLSGSLAKLKEVAQGRSFKVDSLDKLDSHCLIEASGDNRRGCTHSAENLSHSWTGEPCEDEQVTDQSKRSGSGTDSVWSCEPRPLASSSHALVSPSAVLHRQTLSLHPPEEESAQTYARIRAAARARSGGTRPRRK